MFLKLFTLFLLTLLILPNPVSGEEFQDIFCILNESVWTGDWDDVHTDKKPYRNTQTNDHLHGWIDITGFEREIRHGNTTYVYGKPLTENITKNTWLDPKTNKHNAQKIIIDGIILHCDTWHTKQQSKRLSWIRNVYRVTYFAQTLYLTGNTTHINARLELHMTWWYYHKVIGDFYCIRHDETLILYDTIERPIIYPSIMKNVTANIIEYENNISNYSLIKIPHQDGVVFTNFSYKNNSVLRVNKLGLIREGVDGNLTLQFLNDTQAWIVDENQSIIGSHDGGVVIHETPVNLSLLNVTLSSPYESLTINNYNITHYHADPGEVFNAKSLYWFLP